VIARASV